jgi:hypothetical protein
MRTVTRVVIALAAVMGVAVAVPAVRASADVSTCGTDHLERCVALQQNASGNLRTIGSLGDRFGARTVAVVAYVEQRTSKGWLTVEASPRVEAAGYVLAATRWHKCAPAVYRARANWNFNNGAQRGTSYSPSWKVKC